MSSLLLVAAGRSHPALP